MNWGEDRHLGAYKDGVREPLENELYEDLFVGRSADLLRSPPPLFGPSSARLTGKKDVSKGKERQKGRARNRTEQAYTFF